MPGGSFHAKAAALLAGDRRVMAIKLNGNFPGNPAANGLPTVQGVIYLADATNGRPLALMDSIEITINRTGAATTLAARHLARRDSRVATICGAGVQGRIQLTRDRGGGETRAGACLGYRWSGSRATVRRRCRPPSSSTCGHADLAVARESDIVVTCTSARRAFLTPELVRPGTFIAAVGADNSDKQRDRSRALCREPRRSSIRWSKRRRSAICTTPSKPGGHAARTSTRPWARWWPAPSPAGRDDRSITLFDSTGMGLQDVAAAAPIYRRALETGAGTQLSLT